MEGMMNTIIEYNGIQLNKKLIPVIDAYMQKLKTNWYQQPQTIVENHDFVPLADEWFKSTRINNLHGWNQFPYADIILGCTHYIESIIIKYGWDGFQILPEDYAYYGLMGKFGVEVGNLAPNIPLLVSLPNWKYSDLRPEWAAVLQECEQKNIDIHIDMAWIITAKDIEIDLSHPSIKSFAMSMSKYNMQWNRLGLRWSKQRTMDSITIFNFYYGEVNNNIISCGAYMLDNIPRDYVWDTYGKKYNSLCEDHNLIKTKLLHVVQIPDDNYPKGIGHLLE
jgi:hypothetical protein